MKKPQLTNKKGTMTNKKCNECNNENENENLYWDNELDKPNMVYYTCLCQSCYNKLSIETQLGYYVYKPFDYETDIYQRVGVKYYIYKNIFTGVGLKAHGGRAEAGEFSIGIRL